MDNPFSHQSVLCSETVNCALPSERLVSSLRSSGVTQFFCVDATLGGAGHARSFVEWFAKRDLFSCFDLVLLGFDLDEAAIRASSDRLSEFKKLFPRFQFHLFQQNFSSLKETFLASFSGNRLHAFYADFGVSSPQLDRPERGFSLMRKGPLDMRMNTEQGQTARELLETLTEAQLVHIFFTYGEEPKARKLAHAIVRDRQSQQLPLHTTVDFADYVRRILGYPTTSRTHPATRVFQALRIAVNQELNAIEDLLKFLPELMCPLAKACFISFHSLEDRLVKRAMRNWQEGKTFSAQAKSQESPPLHLHFPLLAFKKETIGFGKEVPRGGLTPTESECQENPRSRSARLRCFEFADLQQDTTLP